MGSLVVGFCVDGTVDGEIVVGDSVVVGDDVYTSEHVIVTMEFVSSQPCELVHRFGYVASMSQSDS